MLEVPLWHPQHSLPDVFIKYSSLYMCQPVLLFELSVSSVRLAASPWLTLPGPDPIVSLSLSSQLLSVLSPVSWHRNTELYISSSLNTQNSSNQIKAPKTRSVCEGNYRVDPFQLHLSNCFLANCKTCKGTPLSLVVWYLYAWIIAQWSLLESLPLERSIGPHAGNAHLIKLHYPSPIHNLFWNCILHRMIIQWSVDFLLVFCKLQGIRCCRFSRVQSSIIYTYSFWGAGANGAETHYQLLFCISNCYPIFQHRDQHQITLHVYLVTTHNPPTSYGHGEYCWLIF